VADYILKFSDALDLNVAIDDLAADVNVTYRMAETFKSFADLSPEGIVTPKKAGSIFVEAVDDQGLVRKKVVVLIETDSQVQLRQDIAAGVKKVVAAVTQIAGGNDQTPPTVASFGAAWSTDVLSVSFGTIADPESGIQAVTLDVRSTDGLDILANTVNITSSLASPKTYSRTKNGKTYDATLTVINGKGLTTTRTAQVAVPAADVAEGDTFFNAATFTVVSNNKREWTATHSGLPTTDEQGRALSDIIVHRSDTNTNYFQGVSASGSRTWSNEEGGLNITFTLKVKYGTEPYRDAKQVTGVNIDDYPVSDRQISNVGVSSDGSGNVYYTWDTAGNVDGPFEVKLVPEYDSLGAYASAGNVRTSVATSHNHTVWDGGFSSGNYYPMVRYGFDEWVSGPLTYLENTMMGGGPDGGGF